jgi:hypothetical protein
LALHSAFLLLGLWLLFGKQMQQRFAALRSLAT